MAIIHMKCRFKTVVTFLALAKSLTSMDFETTDIEKERRIKTLNDVRFVPMVKEE